MKKTLLLTLTVMALLLVNCSDAAEPAERAAESSTEDSALPEIIIQGKAVYADNCASCHGENLEGEVNWKLQNEDGSFRSPPHTADGHTWHHADRVLIEAIKEGGARFEGLNIGGSSTMPAFADTLSDEEITAVLAFIKSTWPEDVQEMQRQQTIQAPSS